MTGVDSTIHASFLSDDNPDASLAFNRDRKEPAHDVGGGRLVTTIADLDGNVLGLLQDR